MRFAPARVSRLAVVAIPTLITALLAACGSAPTEPKARPAARSITTLDGTTDTTAKGPTMPWY